MRSDAEQTEGDAAASSFQHLTAKIPNAISAPRSFLRTFIQRHLPFRYYALMTLAAAPREQTTGVLAVVQAFLAQLLAMLRSVAYRKELERKLRSYEHRLLHGLFGAHLRHDPEFMARSRTDRLAFLRKTGRTLQALRAQRLREHAARTLLGRGYVKHPGITMAIRFAHRFVRRPMRRLACARLAFVASTRELRAGAPP